jgi:hypothetical protein
MPTTTGTNGLSAHGPPSGSSSGSAERNTENTGNKKVKLGSNIIKTFPTTSLYFISLVGPSVLVGFFLILSIFNQNLKGIAYLIGICVLSVISSMIGGMYDASSGDHRDPKCAGHGLFFSNNGLPYGTLIYVFSFFYLLMPMLTNGIVNMPLLVSLILVTVLDALVNSKQGCSNSASIALSVVVASLAGTLWSTLIYSIKPELTYHTDYISSNKLACSLPSKQKFKCVVKKNGEIIG